MNKIARNITMPVMLALVLVSLLVAALTFLAAEIEFHQFDHLSRKMPVFAATFRSIYAAAWLLPFFSGGVAIWFLRQPERTATQFAWSVSIVTVLLVAWVALAFTALYTLHVASSYYL